jgi:hypothetical protein
MKRKKKDGKRKAEKKSSRAFSILRFISERPNDCVINLHEALSHRSNFWPARKSLSSKSSRVEKTGWR